jgi:phage terminase large subunit-like protein
MGARGPGAKPVKKGAQVGQPADIVAEAGRTRAERLVNWIETLIVPSGQLAGQPFRLQPWQKRIIRDLYRTDRRGRRVVRTGLVSMGRKNGKSGLAAALALAHLAGPEAIRGGQALSGAADRGQAGIIFEGMKAMALASPALRDRLNIKVFSKQIEDTETGSTYAALSSDARKAHGTSPSFWIADEVAQWRGRDLLDALRTGMGAHAEPLGIIISTRSPDPTIRWRR